MKREIFRKVLSEGGQQKGEGRSRKNSKCFKKNFLRQKEIFSSLLCYSHFVSFQAQSFSYLLVLCGEESGRGWNREIFYLSSGWK